MGMIPGTLFEATFATHVNGLLVDATIQTVELFYGQASLGTTIAIAVVPLGGGVFGYSFQVPSAWKHDDRVAILVTYSYGNASYKVYSPIGPVQWNLHDLEFLGFTKDQGMDITDSSTVNSLTLPDGRQVVVEIVGTGETKQARRADS